MAWLGRGINVNAKVAVDLFQGDLFIVREAEYAHRDEPLQLAVYLVNHSARDGIC
jgi:hypothetical protein